MFLDLIVTSLILLITIVLGNIVGNFERVMDIITFIGVIFLVSTKLMDHILIHTLAKNNIIVMKKQSKKEEDDNE